MGMPHSRRAIVALAGTATFAAPASAQSIAEFYKGKTIAILMGTGPGGSYDPYGRVIGEHLSPPHPMEHMPGAGGAIAGNHL
jgi:tripartite-type tricarboxylate transporter receptor subunit TctC